MQALKGKQPTQPTLTRPIKTPPKDKNMLNQDKESEDKESKNRSIYGNTQPIVGLLSILT